LLYHFFPGANKTFQWRLLESCAVLPCRQAMLLIQLIVSNNYLLTNLLFFLTHLLAHFCGVPFVINLIRSVINHNTIAASCN